MGDDFVVIPQLHAQVVQARLVPDGAALPLRVGRRAAGCTKGVIPDPTAWLTLSRRAVGRDLNQKQLSEMEPDGCVDKSYPNHGSLPHFQHQHRHQKTTSTSTAIDWLDIDCAGIGSLALLLSLSLYPPSPLCLCVLVHHV